MTPLPKRRHSSRRSGKRKAERILASRILVKCPKCDQLKIPHTVCLNCGYYKEESILEIKQKKEKNKT